MTENTPIEVRRVANGFIVRPSPGDSDRNCMVWDHETFVCEDLVDLYALLAAHFPEVPR